MRLHYLLQAIYRSVRSVRHLGAGGSLTLFQAHFGQAHYSIIPRGYQHSLEVRGGTTDAKVLYDTFCRRDYPVARDRPIYRIIGAGANVGYTAIYFAHHHPQATILAIEPESANFVQLARNCKPYPHIVPLYGALWPLHETVFIADPDTSSWAFSCTTTPPSANAEPLPTFTVSQLKEAYGWDTIDIVKIDIEGGEKALFSNNTGWLSATNQIYMEIHGDNHDTVLNAVKRFPHTVRSKRSNYVFTFQHTVHCIGVSLFLAETLSFI